MSMKKYRIFILFLLSSLWLQAVIGRRYFESSYHHHKRDDYKRIAKKIRDYLKQKDPYFGGDNNNGDDQPEITEKDLPKDGDMFEEDIVMDSYIRRAVLGLNDKRSAEEMAEEGKRKHWPNGIVPYVIDKSLKPALVEQVHKAIAELKELTCIKYVPRSPADEDYVVFKDGKGCSSSVGRVGGEQYIHLASGCKRIGTVIHEMMHAIGIIHEQSRSDRDEYIKIRFDYIKKDLQSNFRKYDFGQADNMDIPYNFFSVMHYSNYAFSKNDEEETIISRADPHLRFGQRVQLTCLDVKQINRLYPCDKECPRRGLVPDMTERDVERRKRDSMKDLYHDLF